MPVSEPLRLTQVLDAPEQYVPPPLTLKRSNPPPTITKSVLGVLAPQVLFAVTEIVPAVEPTVVSIEFVVEFPIHPDGSDQV